jgi:succinyl-diaminopimelate desuccinylase
MADDFTKIEQTIDKYRNEVIELERLMTSIPALGPENGGDGEMKKATA